MQHLCSTLEGGPAFTGLAAACQALVRFFAWIELSHMLLRLCGPPSISLSFNLATVLPRRCTYRVSYGTGRVKSPHTKCTPFTVGTTRVSNPVCSPNFRASVSVAFQRAAFATGVPLDINAFHRYTKNSALLSCTLAPQFSNAVPPLSGGLSRPTHRATYAPFTPSKSEQRLPPLYYRGCWHRVSRGFLHRYHLATGSVDPCSLAPGRQEFTTRRPSSSTQRRIVTLSRIANDPRLQPPVGVWAVSQSRCG